jgi:hypothetical protein
MSKTIDNSVSLRSLIETAINGGMKSALYSKALQEKEKQASQKAPEKSSSDSGGGQGIFSDDSSNDTQDPNDGGSSSKTMDDENEKLKSGDVSLDDIVEKLNAIRSGRSFKDEEISSKMEQYVKSLSKTERVALLAFLKGIAQIVTGEIEAQAADDPSKSPSNVEMQKTNAPEKKTLKPNVIKTSPVEKSKNSSVENTKGPTPITPKKR